jgi:ribosomal-protein-alanine N-acetyltransferase
MKLADLDDVCAIERELFSTPWSRQAFEADLKRSPPTLALVSEEQGRVVGYVIGWIIEDEFHIGNVAVTTKRQGRGIAKRLLTEGIRIACERGVRLATLEVRSSNERAIGLYERYGFRPVAIRRGYYSDNGEDAIVMLAEVGERIRGHDGTWNEER